LFTNNIITYISNFICSVMSGLFIAALLGNFWSRTNWQGGLASLLAGSITSFIILGNYSITDYWGNPIIPSMIGALIANVVVSLITPKEKLTKQESVDILVRERERLDEGTTISDENSL